MTTTAPLGRVSDLCRFPVKSMQGERLTEARIGAEGLAGDRAYALLDGETGEVISASNVRHFPGILDCVARFTEPHRGNGEAPPVRVTLPGGASASSESGALSSLLSTHFGDPDILRSVTQFNSLPVGRGGALPCAGCTRPSTGPEWSDSAIVSCSRDGRFEKAQPRIGRMNAG